MRINKYIALHTGVSRRKADELILHGLVLIDSQLVSPGYDVTIADKVSVRGKVIRPIDTSITTIMLNKPVGYVCSRDGQGSKTVYELLNNKYQNLKPVGRLDKDSSGLLLLSNDGELSNRLTHPRFEKTKVYQVELNRGLTDRDATSIKAGVKLGDGISKLELFGSNKDWEIKMHEGRNRQIRRTFATLDYSVINLHRTQIGEYLLDDLGTGKYRKL